VLDLSNTRALTFCSSDEAEALIPRSLPSQLTSMSLKRLNLVKALSESIPQKLSFLTSLSICNARIEGDLQRYLFLPELKELHFCDVLLFEIEERYAAEKPLNGGLFLTTPKLELVTLTALELDEDLVNGLKKCTTLQQLTIKSCLANQFIESFARHLRDHEDSFSKLQALHVQETWPRKSGISYDELVRHCATERPIFAYLVEILPR
jgi:hypothetical protein